MTMHGQNHIKIRLSVCNLCGRTDTLQHRLTDCTEGVDKWLSTRSRNATILRTDPSYIRPERTIRPCFQFWPPQRHGAVLWILAHMISYLLQRRRVTSADYEDFMRRPRWKMYQKARRWEKVGDYLGIL